MGVPSLFSGNRNSGVINFARGAHIWQPVRGRPTDSADGDILYHRFTDNVPADYIQLAIEGVGRTLQLVRTENGPITPPSQKHGPLSQGRFTSVRLEFKKKHVLDRVELPRNGGPIGAVAGGIEKLPELAVIESVYRRSKATHKPKILNRLVLHDERPCSNIHSSLERFDHLYCADTNTVNHCKGYIWITAICEGEVKRLSYDEALLQWRPVEVLYTRATSDDSGEIQGWLAAIAFIEETRSPAVGRRALVVDAHLGNLDAYSTRTRPLVGEMYLPDQWQLLYASSDAGTQEFLPNVMLARAHRNARVIGRRLKKRPLTQLSLAD